MWASSNLLLSLFLSVILFSGVIAVQPLAFAEDHTIISIKIIGEPEIYLDSGSKMIRADVEIKNYNPSHGYYFMRISNSDKIITETEIFPAPRGNDRWGVQIGYMVTSETPDTFKILIFSEFGKPKKTATFSVLETKPIVQQAVKTEADESEPVPEPEVNEELKQKLPDWVRNIFIWYAEGQIDEEELIGALQFLIKEEIIEV